MATSRSELLAAVERSPEAAGAHDKGAWVGLFTDDARIDDPVGSRPHVGRDQIGRFYDTFIGPRDITFHRDLDIVSGTSVIRDLTLDVGMSPAVRMMIPAFLRYDLRAAESGWQIARLRAYWELPVQIGQFVRHGLSSVPVSLRLASALLGNQRLGGALGFASGLHRPAARAKQLVARTWNCDKVIAAGSTVAASMTTADGRGVVFADVEDRGRRLGHVERFTDESA
jgi:hypothetical protein